LINKNYILLFAIFCFLNASVYAQNVLDILHKSDQFYQTNNLYEIKMTYNVFRGFTGSKVTETYEGFVQKKYKYSKTSMLDSDIVQYDKSVLIIDNQEKLISYEKFVDGRSYTPIILEIFEKDFKKTKVTDKGSFWYCEMINSQEVTQIPYGKVVFHINKTDYQITKQVLYFNSQIPFNVQGNKIEMDYGRIEIDLSLNGNPTIIEIPLEKYLDINEKGEIQLQEEYLGYELVEQ
jgi:hypothetical protein